MVRDVNNLGGTSAERSHKVSTPFFNRLPQRRSAKKEVERSAPFLDWGQQRGCRREVKVIRRTSANPAACKGREQGIGMRSPVNEDLMPD